MSTKSRASDYLLQRELNGRKGKQTLWLFLYPNLVLIHENHLIDLILYLYPINISSY